MTDAKSTTVSDKPNPQAEAAAAPPPPIQPLAMMPGDFIQKVQPSIYALLPRITGEVAAISKARKNVQQGYSFRGVDDVYAALNPLLAKHGVSIIPVAVEPTYAEHQTKNGGSSFRVRTLVTYLLAAADGSSILAQVLGEGMDSGDKAAPKALSGAYKTLCFQIFAIPTEEKKDAEDDDHEVVHPAAKPAAPPNQNHAGPRAPPAKPAEAPKMSVDQQTTYDMLLTALRPGFNAKPHADAWAKKYKPLIATLPEFFQAHVTYAFSKAKTGLAKADDFDDPRAGEPHIGDFDVPPPNEAA